MATTNLAHVEQLCHQLLDQFQTMAKLLQKLWIAHATAEVELEQVKELIQDIKMVNSEKEGGD